MARSRAISAAGLVAVGALALAGCQIDRAVGATCSTSPPAPHQELGTVEVSADLPPRVVAGSTFTIRVDTMTGYAGPPGGSVGGLRTGTLSVGGPVSPAGDWAVGQGLFGGTPFPNERTFTVTGDPGDTIVVAIESGSNFQGSFPAGILTTCDAGGVTLATIQVVAPRA